MHELHRRTVSRAATFALAAIGLASAGPALAKKAPEPPVEYGPLPTWEHFKGLAEAAVRARLVDPGSATFQWPWGYQRGFYKPMLAKRINGYYSCGLVNAKNRMGGYTGNSFFIVVIDHNAVRYVEIAQSGGTLIAETCANSQLPPVTRMDDFSPTKAKFGVALAPVPEGVRVQGVFAGSIAERAGIKTAMVLAWVNGTSLAGMAMEDIGKILGSLPPASKIELADGTVIAVTQP